MSGVPNMGIGGSALRCVTINSSCENRLLGLGNPGKEQHGDAACRKEGSDCDGSEETHGWLLTL